MNVQTPSQQNSMPVMSVRGQEKAKKKPPKVIERMIDKVEEMLTRPITPQAKPQQGAPQAEPSAVELPKGTTITLPDGKAFETQIESTLTKGGE